MDDTDWVDQLNDEYEAATSDAERLAALEKHMSPDMARDALSALRAEAASGTRDLSEEADPGGL